MIEYETKTYKANIFGPYIRYSIAKLSSSRYLVIGGKWISIPNINDPIRLYGIVEIEIKYWIQSNLVQSKSIFKRILPLV